MPRLSAWHLLLIIVNSVCEIVYLYYIVAGVKAIAKRSSAPIVDQAVGIAEDLIIWIAALVLLLLRFIVRIEIGVLAVKRQSGKVYLPAYRGSAGCVNERSAGGFHAKVAVNTPDTALTLLHGL